MTGVYGIGVRSDNFIFGFFGVGSFYPKKAKDKIAGKADR